VKARTAYLVLGVALLLAAVCGWGISHAQTLVNCAPSVPCNSSTGPKNTGTGDQAWLAFGKVNAFFLSPNTTGGYYSSYAVTAPSTYTFPGSGLNAFGWNGSMTGSVSTAQGYAGVDFIANTDNMAVSGATVPVGYVARVLENAGTATMTGNRAAFTAVENIYSATGNTSGTGFYEAAYFNAQAQSPDNGTSFSSPGGHLFGMNANAHLTNGSTFWDQVITQENDIAIETGASANDLIGIQVVGGTLWTVQANRMSAGYLLSNQVSAVGFQYGLVFGAYEGYWPMTTTGTLIGCYAHGGSGACGTVGYGIDFAGLGNGGSAITCTNYCFDSTGFKVDGSGNITGNSLNGTQIGNTTAAAGTFTALTATGGAINLNNAASIGAGGGLFSVTKPLVSAGTKFSVASGTGACATTGTVTGGVQAGQFTCTGTTGASTVTLTLTATSNAYSCAGRDVTTPTTVTQTGAVSSTSVTMTLTSVTSNDVIQVHCLGY
jgi:hypothetical protein